MLRWASHLLRLDKFKLHAAAGPGDEVGVGRVVQQSHQELPKLQGAPALVRRALAIQACFLLYVTCRKCRELLMFPQNCTQISVRDSKSSESERGLTFDLFRNHTGVVVKMPRHFVKHATWKTKQKMSFWHNSQQKPKVHRHNIRSCSYLRSC